MRKFLTLTAALLAISQSANGVPIEAGLFTQNQLRICGSPGRCFAGDTSVEFASDLDLGGTGAVSTQVIDPLDGGAQAASSAGFQGPGFTPALSSYAFSGMQTRFTVGGLAIQRYQFSADGTINLSGALTYSQSGTTAPSGDNPNGLMSAGFISFQMENDVLETDNCNLLSGGITAPNAGGLLSSCILRNGESFGSFGTIDFLGLNSVQSAIFDTGNDPIAGGLATAGMTVSGLQGDVFYLGAFMTSFAHLGGFADSSNTLLLDIDNPSLVTAAFSQQSFVRAPARIPEPGTLTLLGIGLAGIRLARRKKKV